MLVIGLDVHKDSLAAVVVDHAGRQVDCGTFDNTDDGHASLLAWANRRFPTEATFAATNGTAPIAASSGRTERHRLNRGGNRRLNYALYVIAITQTRHEPRAAAYLAKRRAEGKTRREALRGLKRHLSNVVYRRLMADAQETLDT